MGQGSLGVASQVPELRPGVSVVVPCYHSEGSLRPLAERLLAVLPGLAADFEIILVNDGSRDGTWRVIEELARANPGVIVGQNLMRNYGQHGALLSGIREARFATLLTIDDDLQHPPEELPRLFAALTDDIDVVYGTAAKQPHGVLRGLASVVTKKVLEGAMGAETAEKVSALRVFRTELRRAFADYRSAFVSIDVLLTWGTNRFAAVEVRHAPREIGTSNYTLSKLITHALNMMTGFSTIPLQVASLIGFALTGVGVLVLFFVVARTMFEGGAPPGFPFLACLIAIFSGAQLLCLGIIGEYVGRTHFRLLDRPPYVVRTQVGGIGARSAGPEAR